MTEQTLSRFPYWLVISLIVNALLIGLLIGGGLGKRKSGGSSIIAGDERAIVRGLEQSLNDQDRRVLRRSLRSAFERTRDERRELRATRTLLSDALQADPYDRDAVSSAFARLRTADGNMKVGLQEELADQFAKLSVDQRRAIVRNLERRGAYGRRGPRERGDRRPPPPPRD
ncbi:MAG: periplasmic heavy metal sensor [Henriciella sp.]|jgi:uncharacterized membrane protein